MLIAGLVLLLVGGELLVRGAVGMALKWRITPMIIGLTVVSFGTSAPELLVSLSAALDGSADIAIGNVIGSNIANLALVLGVTALIITIPVEKITMILDWPVMMGASLLLWYFAYTDEVLTFYEGMILVVLLVLYIVFLIAKVRKDKKKGEVESLDEEGTKPFWTYIVFLILGIVALVYGADWMVEGAKIIALDMGVSKYVVGVTVIAFGTSLPELATSVIAAVRGQTDISVGNLIGSNIFNIMAVLGITSTVKDINIASQVLSNDIYWFLGVALILFPMMYFTRKIGKVNGLILVAIYVSYIFLVLNPSV